jgi:hypothetical protein
MNSGCVFDTEAITTFLYNGVGHGAVADIFAEAFTSSTDGFLAETDARKVALLKPSVGNRFKRAYWIQSLSSAALNQI